MSKTRGHLTMVIDRSGSMGEMLVEAQGGINQFLADQAALTDDVALTVAIYDFDTTFRGALSVSKMGKVPPKYTLIPGGMTALWDAVGKGIEETRTIVDGLSKKPEKVVVMVITDGKENSSKEHTFKSITALVEKAKEKDGWEFVFLASSLHPATVEQGVSSGMRTTRYAGGVGGQTAAVYNASSAAVGDFFAGQTKTVETPESVEDE